MYAIFWWVNVRERDHVEELGVNGSLKLKRMLCKSVGGRGMHCYGCVTMRYVRYTSHGISVEHFVSDT